MMKGNIYDNNIDIVTNVGLMTIMIMVMIKGNDGDDYDDT